jgi:hypothetical protein
VRTFEERKSFDRYGSPVDGTKLIRVASGRSSFGAVVGDVKLHSIQELFQVRARRWSVGNINEHQGSVWSNSKSTGFGKQARGFRV